MNIEELDFAECRCPVKASSRVALSREDGRAAEGDGLENHLSHPVLPSPTRASVAHSSSVLARFPCNADVHPGQGVCPTEQQSKDLIPAICRAHRRCAPS